MSPFPELISCKPVSSTSSMFCLSAVFFISWMPVSLLSFEQKLPAEVWRLSYSNITLDVLMLSSMLAGNYSYIRVGTPPLNVSAFAQTLPLEVWRLSYSSTTLDVPILSPMLVGSFSYMRIGTLLLNVSAWLFLALWDLIITYVGGSSSWRSATSPSYFQTFRGKNDHLLHWALSLQAYKFCLIHWVDNIRADLSCA